MRRILLLSILLLAGYSLVFSRVDPPKLRKIDLTALFSLETVEAYFATINNAQHLVSTANCASGSGTACAITVASTVAGDSAEFCGNIAGGSLATPTGGDSNFTWVAAPNTTIGTSFECFYNLNLSAGATSISSAVTSGDGRAAYYFQWHSSMSRVSWKYDTSNSATDSSSGNCPGIGLTLNGTNDAIAQFISAAPTVSAINTGYGNLTVEGAGVRAGADLFNTTTGTQPTWTNGTAACRVAAVALMESFKVLRVIGQ